MTAHWRRLKGAGRLLLDGTRLAEHRVRFVSSVVSGSRRRTPERRDRFRFGQRPFTARPIDWNGVREIVVDREYGFLEALLASRSKPRVVDIGANIGLFALYVFSLAEDAVVHSYEPRTSTFDVLLENKSLNKELNWTVYQYAVTAKPGSASLRHGVASTASRIAADGDEVVRTIGLEAVIGAHLSERICLAKIDVEGSEEAILCGRQVELAAIDNLVVEVHPDLCNEQAVYDALTESFPYLHRIRARASAKPLLVATRAEIPLCPAR